MDTFSFHLTRQTGKGRNTLKNGNQMISANDRLHPLVKANITQYLRTLPREYKWVESVYNVDNPWYPTIKALIDGFVDAGLLSDDNNSIIQETRFKSTQLSGTKNYVLNIEFKSLEEGGD